MAAGFYQLPTTGLGAIRDRILARPDEFSGIRAALDKKGLPLMFDNTLKTMPRGYAQHEDHPQADALKLKSFVVSQDQPRETWTSGDIVERMVAMAEAAGPLITFGREALRTKG
jgi:uncharacterized protein (DUF2461 family)